MFATRLDHLAVTVSDIDRSIAFYCDLLGFREESSHDLKGETISRMTSKKSVHMKIVRLICPETPDVQVDLQQYLEPQGKVADSKLGDIANSHFCFEVDDIQKTYRELQSKGVEFVSDPVDYSKE